MTSRKLFSTVAVSAAAALFPALGAEAANAGIPADAQLVKLELCHPKWVLAPNAESSGGGGFDVENPTTDGRHPLDRETVAHDDLSYDPC